MTKELQIKKALCRKSYYHFFLEMWETVVPDPLQENWHIKYLCDELQTVGERVIRRQAKAYDLMINIAPGESKSTLATIMFPVWLWVNDPSIRVISGSYSKDLSTEHAVKSRDVIRSDKFQQLFGDDVVIRDDVDGKTKYETTATGVRNPVSVGGTVTGKHAHLIIVDDPINPKQAASSAYRNAALSWMRETLPTRKVDISMTPTILIMQRLAEDDPAGDWLEQMREGKPIKHICLPADDKFPIEPPELAARYEGGVFNPIRKPRHTLDEIQISLGSRGYAAQMGQQPAPLEGSYIQSSWFQTYSPLDLRRMIEDQTQEAGATARRGLRQRARIDFYLDTAYTQKSTNDPSAILAYIELGERLYLIKSTTVRLEFPALIAFIKQFIAENGYTDESRVVVEPKASGKSIVQTLKLEGFNVIEDAPPSTDKISRVVAVSPKIEAGHVLLPYGESWVDGFLDECKLFPDAKHDDQVDCLTGAIRQTLMKPKRRRRHQS